MLALLGLVGWWGADPYGPLRAAEAARPLFAVVQQPAAYSQAALALAAVYVYLRHGRAVRARVDGWSARRGPRLRADAVAGLLLFATLGFYPRNKAAPHLLLDGLIQFFGDVVTWANLACLAVGAAVLLARGAPPLVRLAERAWRRLEGMTPVAFAAGAGVAALLSAGALALVWFHGEPVATDGVNYRFQAALFAAGRIALPTPPLPNQFGFISMLTTPHWISIVNPGWPALLAAGVVAGLPWLVNPLCHAGTVVLLYALGRRWWDERTGRVAALLGMLSPFLLLPAGTHMSHTSALFGLLLFLWLWTRMTETGGAGWALVAGLALGWAGTNRPLDAAAAALPWGLVTAWRLVRRELRLPAAAALAVGVLVPLALLGWYNARAFGGPTTFGYDLYYGGEIRLGFGQQPDVAFVTAPHTPARAVMDANDQLNAINKILLGWPLPALLFVAVALRAERRGLADRLCMASATFVVGAYFFFPHPEFMYGARYYHIAAGPLLLLVARGVLTLGEAAGPRLAAGGAVATLAFLAAGFAPPTLWYYRPSAPVFQGVQTGLTAALARAQPHAAVVIVDAGTSLAYGQAVWRNARGLDADVIFAHGDRGAAPALRAAFPDRTIYVYAPLEDATRLQPL